MLMHFCYLSKAIYALAHAKYDCPRAVGMQNITILDVWALYAAKGCNIYEGKWVLDNASRPPSTEEDCAYLVNQVTCQRNERPDSLYQIWRWEPNGCTLRRSVTF
ncbi:hypothetical protein AQUCO_07400003v1 [Aquilegia coerulea]|uniref:Trichome birefringence-like N-terminal domain-containing protein n=1 Tax=Aquilegia coerulea TaxID=218851 RepID=A0A2G5C9D2_AQUCA|nr:hypothetical protein AQUCO_07400003v1 [Aquilegia coerulea]